MKQIQWVVESEANYFAGGDAVGQQFGRAYGF